MEKLDIVDENNQLIGIVKSREEISNENLWHRAVSVWIMNENNELLIQKRAVTKKIDPNKWGICAGHVLAGEEVLEAMVREIKEEIGIIVKKEELDLMFIDKLKYTTEENITNARFSYMYFYKTNKKIEEYTIQIEELSEVKYVPLKQIIQDVKNGDKKYGFTSRGYITRVLEELEKRINI